MFDNVLGRGNVPGTRLGIGTVVSVVVHVALVAFVIWFSAQKADEEETPPEVTFFAAPPPPPPPPPPASSTPKTEKKVEKKRPTKKPDTIVQAKDPTPVPQEEQPEEAPEEEPVEGGVEGGVVGGVAGGVVGGVIGGTLGGQIGGQLGGDVLAFGEGMTRPTRIKGRNPVMTREAREARITGRMLVKCTIRKDGDVENCRIIKPLPHMEEAVLSALKTWKMTPITFQGRPVSVDYVFPFVFELD